jgi:hypothetical protein
VWETSLSFINAGPGEGRRSQVASYVKMKKDEEEEEREKERKRLGFPFRIR